MSGFRSYIVLLATTWAFTVCFAVWMMFGVTGIPIREQLDLNSVEFGLLTATPVLTGALFRSHHAAAHGQAIMDVGGATRLVEGWRNEGLSVGFTNGCFDILHAGHVSLLHAARAQCDRLIVGLNSDASVRRLKGPSRPVNDQHDRACVLAALASVDAVVVFEDDTPLSLIEALLPDILIKGADYTIDTVVGADVVQNAGGRVVLVDLVAGKSTTGTIRRLSTPTPTADAANS